MAVEVKSESVNIGKSSVLLVSVKEGGNVIGTCSMGVDTRHNDLSNLSKMFFIGHDPVVNLVMPNGGSKRSDKLISFCPGYAGSEKEIRDVLTDCFNRVNKGESLEVGLREIFKLLQDGVYTVYNAEYYPTDGSGIFFWGAYNISHEVHGSAEYNRTIGMERPYRPCFLIPSEPLDTFLAKTQAFTDESVKTRKVQGIVYHVGGLHSVLLKGHHGAVSCTEKDIPFRCAVIEKISEPYVDQPVDTAPAEGEEPKPEKQVGISGFRSASVKIPLDVMPKDMLRLILETRREYKPGHFNTLVRVFNTVRRKSVSNNVLPGTVLERCDRMPDCEMVESAYAVDNLTDEQLNCLLAGETECNGEQIISANFYTSIVTACNYLQFHDESRFVDFAIAIMENPELVATHEYTAKRVSRLVNSKKLYGYFKSVVESGEERYEKIVRAAEKFVRVYDLKRA